MPKNVVCKKCNNLVNDWCEKVIDSPDPDMQRDCQYFCEKTNADRIRSMTYEELAIYLNVGWECSLCKEQIWINNKFSLGDCDMNCVGHCLEWLRQPAEEVNDGK